MNRKLKALGLALFAVFALSAVGAGAAQAASFNSHEEDIVLEDIEDGTFVPHEFYATTDAPPVVCNDLDVEGRNVGTGSETTWKTSTATVGVDYTECEFEGEPLTVDDDDCHYELGSTTDANGHADVTLKGCAANGGITITINEILTIHVPHQTIKGAVHYTNTGETGEGRTVDVIATAEHNIEYKCTLAFICELGGIAPEGNDASYFGAIEVGGFEYESGTTTSYEVGPQTDVWYE